RRRAVETLEELVTAYAAEPLAVYAEGCTTSGADLVEVVGGRFASAHRSRIAAATSRLVACSSLSFLAARFCLMVLLGFLTVACRGDLSAMAVPARPDVSAPP